MSLQILISSINRLPEEIDEKTRNFSNLVIINQVPNKLDSEVNKRMINNLNWIDIDQKGLSKSRNYALEISNAENVYLTDDDIVLEEDINRIVSEGFKQNPEYDILAFDFEEVGSNAKEHSAKEKKIGYFNSLKLSSVQLVFKLDFIKKNNLKFDELFGAGAKYSMGEENIFLFDSLKKGAKIKYIPETIVKLHKGESSWFRGFNEKFFFDRGASYWRMFSILAPLFSLAYCIKKRNLYQDNFGVLKAFNHSLRGMNDYIATSKNITQ